MSKWEKLQENAITIVIAIALAILAIGFIQAMTSSSNPAGPSSCATPDNGC